MPSSTTAVAGTATSAKRRSDEAREAGEGGRPSHRLGAAIARTRSRSGPAATGRAACSSVISSAEVIVSHLLFEFGRARLSRVETAVGLMPSTRAVCSPSSSITIRSASTSRSPALSVASASWRAGDRPSTKSASCASGSAAASSRRRRRDSARNQSSAVVRAIPSSHVRARAAARVEARPLAERLLERRAREVVRERAVARQVEQVAEDVVEMLLGRVGERLAARRCCVRGRVSVIACTTVLRRRVAVASHRLPDARPARRGTDASCVERSRVRLRLGRASACRSSRSRWSRRPMPAVPGAASASAVRPVRDPSRLDHDVRVGASTCRRK